MRGLAFGIAGWIWLAGAVRAGEPVVLFREEDGGPGRVHTLGVADMNPHLRDEFWWTENWFFIAVAEDGHLAYVNLMLSNLGLKKHQPALSFTIITPQRVRHTTAAEFAPQDFQWRPEQFELRVADNLVQGDDQNIQIKVSQEGLGLDLIFAGKMRGYQLGDGKAWFGRDRAVFFYQNLPAPRPVVSGTITVRGVPRQVRGWGYVDHVYYNANATDFEEVWHNWKFYSPEISINLSHFTTPADYDSDFSLASILDDHGVICVTTEVSVTEQEVRRIEPGHKPYPQRMVYEVRCADGTRAKASFDARSVVEALDVLDKLNQGAATRAVKLLINTFIARPFFYRAIGPVEVEFTRPGETRLIPGQAVSEVIFTR